MSFLERQTLEQRYAIAVHTKVEAYKNNSSEKDSYGGMAFTLPIMIRSAGLVQALHFASTRKKQGQQDFLRDLASVLNEPDLLKVSREAALTEYMQLTRKTLAVLVWFKRFAQSILDLEASDVADLENGEN
ncbi:type III-B CRISPR module-associated protein Cmr5 [Herpetosiphon llansteffanensis]